MGNDEAASEITGRILLLGGALVVVGYSFYRRWQVRWGATDDEVVRPMPGDDLVPRPWFRATRAISIDAPPSAVWPWIVQMGGYTRAGWYSIDRIDNAGRPSADRIVPELQHLAVGDVMPTMPDGTGFRVEAVEPERSLVLAIRLPGGVVSSVFVLEDRPPRGTRLVTRLRFAVRPSPLALAWAAAMDAGDFVMFRRTLLGIRERAERSARVRPGAAEPEDHSCGGAVLDFDLAVEIRRPPAVVYDVLAHKERYAVHPGSPVSRLERLTPGSTRVGTRWVEVVPLLPGVRLTIRSVSDRAEPGVSLGESFTSALFAGHLLYTFEPVDGGTRLRQRQTLLLRGPFGPLARQVDAALRPRLLRRLADIRDLLETADDGAGEAASSRRGVGVGRFWSVEKGR